MKVFKLTLVIAALTFFALACNSNAPTTNQASSVNTPPAANNSTPTTPASTPDELAAARADYTQFCIRCHRPDGTGGDFELEDGAKLKVPNLREHGRKDSDKHLSDKINKGGDGMPAFKGKLEQERIDNLVRFIRRDFHGQAATSGATSPAPSR
jgi:cytochrome c551